MWHSFYSFTVCVFHISVQNYSWSNKGSRVCVNVNFFVYSNSLELLSTAMFLFSMQFHLNVFYVALRCIAGAADLCHLCWMHLTFVRVLYGIFVSYSMRGIAHKFHTTAVQQQCHTNATEMPQECGQTLLNFSQYVAQTPYKSRHAMRMGRQVAHKCVKTPNTNAFQKPHTCHTNAI